MPDQERAERNYTDAVENRPAMLAAHAPRPENPNQMRRIEIVPKGYGFVVTVGCQEFAIETKERLLEKLTSYLFNPAETEQKWFDGTLFK